MGFSGFVVRFLRYAKCVSWDCAQWWILCNFNCYCTGVWKWCSVVQWLRNTKSTRKRSMKYGTSNEDPRIESTWHLTLFHGSLHCKLWTLTSLPFTSFTTHTKSLKFFEDVLAQACAQILRSARNMTTDPHQVTQIFRRRPCSGMRTNPEISQKHDHGSVLYSVWAVWGWLVVYTINACCFPGVKCW